MSPFTTHLCVLIAAAILPNVAAGSFQSRRYAAYDYDLTTPQYTPDGRLLQVEYATNACMRGDSNPIVCVSVNTGEKGPVMIMATVSSPPATSSSKAQAILPQNGGPERGDGEEIELSLRQNHQRAQFRIIEVPLAASYRQSSTQQSATSTILIGLSGVLSDATSLVQVAYSHLEEEQRTFGWHRLGLSPVGINDMNDESVNAGRSFTPTLRKQSLSIMAQPSETVRRLSRAIADKCQKHAFGGGLRPFGASLLLAGGDNARVVMCETHPNGGLSSQASVISQDGSTAGESENDHDSIDSAVVMVSGGPAQSQHKLKSSIQFHLQKLRQKSHESEASASDEFTPSRNNVDDDTRISDNVEAEGEDAESIFLRKVLQSILSSLLEEWRSRGNVSLTSGDSKPAPLADENSAGVKSKTEQKHSIQQPSIPLIEVVMSSKRGTIRLTRRDVVRLTRPE